VRRKVSTSRFSAAERSVSSPAAFRTSPAALPVSAAAWLTPEMLDVTSCVPAAACCTFTAISLVAAPCSSTAEAIMAAIELTWPMVSPIPRNRPPRRDSQAAVARRGQSVRKVPRGCGPDIRVDRGVAAIDRGSGRVYDRAALNQGDPGTKSPGRAGARMGPRVKPRETSA